MLFDGVRGAVVREQRLCGAQVAVLKSGCRARSVTVEEPVVARIDLDTRFTYAGQRLLCGSVVLCQWCLTAADELFSRRAGGSAERGPETERLAWDEAQRVESRMSKLKGDDDEGMRKPAPTQRRRRPR